MTQQQIYGKAVIDVSQSILIARGNQMKPHGHEFGNEKSEIQQARELLNQNGDSYVRLDKLEKALGAHIEADKLTYVAVEVQLKLLLQD
jgi:hypothetical protein